MLLGKVIFSISINVDISDPSMVTEAKDMIFDDLVQVTKNLASDTEEHFDLVADSSVTKGDIPEYLLRIKEPQHCYACGHVLPEAPDA